MVWVARRGAAWRDQEGIVKNQREVREALESIRQAHDGILRAEDVVEAAADPDSPLHRHFQWDDGKAAHQYRLIQARNLITVYVEVLPGVSQEPVQVYVSLAQDRQEVGGGYRRIRDVLADPDMRARLVDEALAEFERAKAKYGQLVELAEVFEAIDRVRASRDAGQDE